MDVTPTESRSMCANDNDKVLVKVFAQLAQYWEAEAPPEEIGSDVAKIEIMNEVIGALKKSSVAIPEKVSQLYAKVYLRDVWS